jgi:enoyl-CoA hydratase/carnithine racemase
MTAVRMQEREEACVLIVDDGKANAYSPALIDEVRAALDRAEKGSARVVVLAGRERLSKRYFERAVLPSELYSPEGAQDAGFLDRVVPAESVLAAALEEAFRLGELDAGAYASTERRAHGAVLGRIRESLQADLGEPGALAT